MVCYYLSLLTVEQRTEMSEREKEKEKEKDKEKIIDKLNLQRQKTEFILCSLSRNVGLL